MSDQGEHLVTVPRVAPARTDQTMDSVQLAVPVNGFHLEPRCRVCRNDEMRRKVNDLLAAGLSYAMILRALQKDNDQLDNRDRVTIDSIRNHTARHFPVQNIARATYRRILERRAQENGVDFIKGVATAITPMAFFETVMVKGYETLVDSDTKVDVNTAMIAAGRLQALMQSQASSNKMVDMWAQMSRIIEVMHHFVPEERHEELLRQLEWQGPVAADTPADEFEDCDDAEDEYGPVEPAQAAGTRQCHGRGQAGLAITEKVHEGTHRPMRVFVPPTQTEENDGF
jgi:hypothetical protein